MTNTIRLMKLPVKVQTRVAAGVISAGHARALLGLADAEAQDALATRIVAEGMSVRATEEAVAMAAAEQPGGQAARPAGSPPPVSRSSARRLSDMFETKVKIQIGRSKGKIVVEFGSVDDLQRIIGVMAPEITGRRPRPDRSQPSVSSGVASCTGPLRSTGRAQRSSGRPGGRAAGRAPRRARGRRPRPPSGTSTSR